MPPPPATRTTGKTSTSGHQSPVLLRGGGGPAWLSLLCCDGVLGFLGVLGQASDNQVPASLTLSLCSLGGPTKAQKSSPLRPGFCVFPPAGYSMPSAEGGLWPWIPCPGFVPHCPLSPLLVLPQPRAPLPWATWHPVSDALGTEIVFPQSDPPGDSQCRLQLGPHAGPLLDPQASGSRSSPEAL